MPDICEGWKADEIDECHPYYHNLPPTLTFLGVVPLEKTEELGNCMYFNLRQVLLKDGNNLFHKFIIFIGYYT